jgi:hypothetical protein
VVFKRSTKHECKFIRHEEETVLEAAYEKRERLHNRATDKIARWTAVAGVFIAFASIATTVFF